MTTPFKHENVIKIAGVLGAQPELRLTSGGNSVATLIVYTNYIVRTKVARPARRASATG
jgi:hypothetical protein